MKKIYLFLILSAPLFLRAQTITQIDLPNAGTAYIMASDSNYVSSILPGGTGQTWNYTGLLNVYTDTSNFQAAAGTPYASAFSGANLSMHNLADDSYSYLTNSSSGLYFNGQASSSGNFIYNPSILVVPVPFSFGSTRNSMARVQVDTSIVDTSGTTNLRVIIHDDSHFEADGSGTLNIPSGSFSNVLRIKTTQTAYDSILVDVGFGIYVPFSTSASQIVTYNYVTSGLPNNLLLQIDADSLGTTSTSSSYYLTMFNSIPTVSNFQENKPYPNPAVNSINFKSLVANYSINIYNSNGQKVLSTASESSQSLDVSSLINGNYIYEMIVNDKVQKGNFIIQH